MIRKLLSGPDETMQFQSAKSDSIDQSNLLNTSTSRFIKDSSTEDISSSTRVLSTDKSIRRTTAEPDYYFRNVISEEVLHNYLDRAITMQHFCSNILDPPDIIKGLEAIKYVKPKFIGRIVGFWGGSGKDEIDYAIFRLKSDIPIIHSYDPDIICQGAIFEHVDGSESNVEIPSYVLSAFGLSSSYLGGTRTTFDRTKMLYDDTSLPYDGDLKTWSETPDITKIETKLWFYYLATTYIAHGCEAIHFGDMPVMAMVDEGKRHCWDLLTKVRAFATRYNRGVVLCDAHAFIFGAETIYGFYHDPERSKILRKPDWERQLVFDFHSLGIVWSKPFTPLCTDTYQPFIIRPGSGILNQSSGGINPQGWYCMHNPVLIEYDNGGSDSVVGCRAIVGYGWDNITWFYQQFLNREKILQYSHYRIKCLDAYAHFQPPVRRYIKPPDPSKYVYNAPLSDQTVIKKLWEGVYSTPPEWVFNEFTDNNVAKYDIPPASSLVFSGSNRIFFIANDGYIHGYIKTGGNYNGGTWLTVSPSYAANSTFAATQPSQRIDAQVKAKSDLVMSHDGSKMFYIGTDGYIHGFIILDDWSYSYFTFMKDEMRAQSILAVGSLICPSNNLMYYIASYGTAIDTNRVHGFYFDGLRWNTTSPSYASGPIGSQSKAGGSLTYDSAVSPNRIYYRTESGYLSYYNVIDAYRYEYHDCMVNSNLRTQNLRIVGNLSLYNNGSGARIYIVGEYIDGSRYIHCLVDNGHGWNTVSPSYSADIYGGTPIRNQAQAVKGLVAVSPDGSTIVYFGRETDGGISKIVGRYFENIDNINFAYKTLPTIYNSIPNSLQFTDNTNFYCILPYKVHHYNKAENYCNNPLIKAPNYP
jgi:hypothetical protein